MLKFRALAAALSHQFAPTRRPATPDGPQRDAPLQSAARWLCRAQDATADDGVAIRYCLRQGWLSSYPETTGYIIPTFLDLAREFGDDSFRERAGRMARWEKDIQRPDGFYVGGALNEGIGPIVFDTGQIILGLLAWYRHSGEASFLESALAAGRALCGIQNEDGSWTTHSFMGIPHTYHSRVAWPLAALGKAAEEPSFVEAARANIDWALSRQQDNSWFQDSGFTVQNHRAPYTHTIAYTIRGILETGLSAERDDYVAAARLSADHLLTRVDARGVPARPAGCRLAAGEPVLLPDGQRPDGHHLLEAIRRHGPGGIPRGRAAAEHLPQRGATAGPGGSAARGGHARFAPRVGGL